jgi:hypothetical protein
MAAQLLDFTQGVLNLKVKAGDQMAFILIPGSDLSAYDFTGQVRAKPAADSPVLGSWIFDLTDPTRIVCRLIGSVTRVLPPKSVYDIQVRIAAGDPTTLFGGTITLVQDVTRIGP